MTNDRSGSARRTVRRRNKITRSDSITVAIVGCAAGVGTLFAHLHPTGWRGSDIAISFVFTLFVVWTAASAPWWALVVAGAAAGVASSSVAWGVVAGVAVIVPVVIGYRNLNQPVLRSLAAALTLQTLFRARLGTFGASALLTLAVVALIVGCGLARRNRFIRRRVVRGLLAVGGFVVIAVVGITVGALSARHQLEQGERALKDGASAVRRGDSSTAAQRFAAASEDFGGANSTLHRPWSVLALATPVLGQHVRLLDDLAASAHSVAGTVAVEIRGVNLDSLRLSGGVINVNAVQALGVPVQRTHDALVDLSHTLHAQKSPWLVGAVGRRVRSVSDQVDSLVTQTDRAAQALSIAPNMLGVSGVRTYFLGFTNPAEARGLGGFLGNWAEIQIIDGKITVVRSGRTKDLFPVAPNQPILTQPAEFFARYGRFGAGGNGHPTAVDYWSNITMSPDLPTVANVIADLYPQSGGEPIDGVIMVDPSGLAGLLKLTGPVTAEGISTSIDANSVSQFLMRDQYTAFPDAEPDRAEALQKVTQAATVALLGGDLPGVRVIADALAPALRDGHLTIWSLKPADQPALTSLGVSGALPSPTGDGISIVTNNAGGNKLDAYMKRTVTYTGTAEPATGQIETVATVSLTNDTPSNVLDLPAYVAGNAQQLPKGTNRTYVSVYSLSTLSAATQDGAALGTEAERERGWAVSSVSVDIAPGATVHLTFSFHGTFDPKVGYRLVLPSQSLAYPEALTVRVTTPSGALLASYQNVLVGLTTLGVPPTG